MAAVGTGIGALASAVGYGLFVLTGLLLAWLGISRYRLMAAVGAVTLTRR